MKHCSFLPDFRIGVQSHAASASAMGTRSQEKGRHRFLGGMKERRSSSSKKRAPSFDGTVDSDAASSLEASHRNFAKISNLDKGNPSASFCCKNTELYSQEHRPLPSLLDDPLYKNNVALRNRVAALNAQQQLLGEAHPDVLFALQNLAGLHYRRGEISQAHRVLAEQQVRRDRAQHHEQPMNIPEEISIPMF